MSILLQLYWSFVKIGFTSFGGLSMIPLITDEMLSHGWMTAQEVSDIVAIAEMTPGPMGFNCATFAGIRTAGLPGAICANLGVLTPALTLTMVAAVFLERFRKSNLMGRLMSGVRPASLGLLLGMAVTMCMENYVTDGAVSIPLVLLGALDVYLLMGRRFTVAKLICLNAGLGLLLFGVLGL